MCVAVCVWLCVCVAVCVCEWLCVAVCVWLCVCVRGTVSDSRALVYRRRICMDCSQPIDEEAATATEINQAAHKLLFGEAVHPVVSGHYLVSNDDAHRLAALHLLSEVGQYEEAGDQKYVLATSVVGCDTSRIVLTCHVCGCVWLCWYQSPHSDQFAALRVGAVLSRP